MGRLAVAGAVGLVIGALFLTAPAQADCVLSTLERERELATAVFSGLVTEADRPWWRIFGYEAGEPHRYTVKVNLVYKGDIAAETTVVAFIRQGPGQYAVGDRVVIFADDRAPYGLVARSPCLPFDPATLAYPYSDGHPPRSLTLLERIGIGPLVAFGIAAAAGIWAVSRWRRRHPIRLEGGVST